MTYHTLEDSVCTISYIPTISAIITKYWFPTIRHILPVVLKRQKGLKTMAKRRHTLVNDFSRVKFVKDTQYIILVID